MKISDKLLRQLLAQSLPNAQNQAFLKLIQLTGDKRYYQQRAAELIHQSLQSPQPMDSNLRQAITLLLFARIPDSPSSRPKPPVQNQEERILYRALKNCRGKRRKHKWRKAPNATGDVCEHCAICVLYNGTVFDPNGITLGQIPPVSVDWCPVNQKHVRGDDGRCDYCRTVLGVPSGTTPNQG